jgi:hypothetical protein
VGRPAEGPGFLRRVCREYLLSRDADVLSGVLFADRRALSRQPIAVPIEALPPGGRLAQLLFRHRRRLDDL